MTFIDKSRASNFELSEKIKARLKKLACSPPKQDKNLHSFDKWKVMKSAFTLTGLPIRYASDFSGMESFMEAFKRLGVQKRVQLQFCSDIDVDCRTWLREMHGAQNIDQCNIYKDLKQRNFSIDTQWPHIYTAVNSFGAVECRERRR